MAIFGKIVTQDNLPQHTKQLTLLSPLNGRVKPLDSVPNLLFSQRIFGEGIAIEPAGYQVICPFDCKIEHFPVTKHQLRIRAKNGLRVLIQIGIGSEHLMGEGFKSKHKAGDIVNKGELLLEFDSIKLKKQLPSMLSPLTIINSQKFKGIKPHFHQVIAGEDTALTLYI